MAVIISTRPLEDALIDAEVLADYNVVCLPAPMMTINPLDVDFNQLYQDITADAVALTSRHAVGFIAGSAWADTPIYCVGESTARLAHDAGLTHIITGSGDGDGLIKMIADSRHQHIFWPSAVDVGFDLVKPLSGCGVNVTRVPIYKAATTEALPDNVIEALNAGHVTGVMVHSGRAGAHFTDMLDRYELGHIRSSVHIIAVSARVAGHCGKGWRNIDIAATPRRSAMFDSAVILMNTKLDSGQSQDNLKDS